MNKKENITTIGKGLRLLELLGEHPEGLTLPELVARSGHARSSVHKIAANLMETGYVGRDPSTMRYFLTRKLLLLGLSAVGHRNIIELSEAPMTTLCERWGESVMIGTLAGREVALLRQIPGTHDFVFALKPGIRFPLHSTAPGKALLAFMERDKRRRVLASLELTAFNKHTVTDPALLEKELDRIVEGGYAQDINETVEGVHCVAAPVFDERGRAVACVWTSGPVGRLPRRKLVQVGREVAATGLEISRNLGFKPRK